MHMRKLILCISFSSLLFSTVTFAQFEFDKLRTIPFSKVQIMDTTSTIYLYSFSKSALGLLSGNNQNSQIGLVAMSLNDDANKNLQNNFNTIGQVKMSFGSLAMPRSFVLVNEMGLANSLLLDQGSKPQLANNNWIVRGIIGIDSRPFLNNFTAGLGVGAAVINQNLNGNLVFLNMPSVENSQITIRPSVLANATWLACPNCIGGLGGSISFQIAADQYPSMMNGMSYEGFSYQFGGNQKWQLSEMLIFNMQI